MAENEEKKECSCEGGCSGAAGRANECKGQEEGAKEEVSVGEFASMGAAVDGYVRSAHGLMNTGMAEEATEELDMAFRIYDLMHRKLDVLRCIVDLNATQTERIKAQMEKVKKDIPA